MAETVQLLSEIGIRDGSPFESNGITGGDLLDLDDDELKEDLHLTNLQVHGLNDHARFACFALTAFLLLLSYSTYGCTVFFVLSHQPFPTGMNVSYSGTITVLFDTHAAEYPAFLFSNAAPG